jgi:DNA-binding transcriptional regulator YdaS (Cro superfamily)
MTRKTKAVIAVIAVAALASLLVAPSAFAQQSGSDPYGEDVYGGADQGATNPAPADNTLAKKAATSWTMLSTNLTGEVEVPPGDSSASGSATIKVSDSQVCFDVKWTGIKATASHIHLAPKGKAGAIVVPFFKADSPISETRKQGCTEVSATLAKAIANNPSAYYVNVHDTQFPKGAIRGQLAKDSGNGSALPYTGSNRSRGLLLLSLSVVIAGSMLLAAGQRRKRPVHARR